MAPSTLEWIEGAGGPSQSAAAGLLRGEYPAPQAGAAGLRDLQSIHDTISPTMHSYYRNGHNLVVVAMSRRFRSGDITIGRAIRTLQRIHVAIYSGF